MPWPDVRAIIAILMTVGTLALMGALIYLKSDQLSTAIGFFFGFWTGIGSYYFGSSSGSTAKDEVLSKLASNGTPKP